MSTESIRITLAKNIKHARKMLNLTQVELAEYADISESYMNDLERCRNWPSDETLTKIAKALHKEPWELFLPVSDGELLSSPPVSYKDATEAEFSKHLIEKINWVAKDFHAFIDVTAKELVAMIASKLKEE